ncbi:hypothetical protein BASA81_000857 [Batrachochytrium salamandrivorans]|nr:hypothetical protein BASA81_000857 [Batrachochytrium salamandrivorans]
MESSLLDRMATLETKADGEIKKTLEELRETLDPINPQDNRTRGQAVLENKAVMGVLLKLSATPCSIGVAEPALCVLALLAQEGGNAKRLYQEYPSFFPVAMHKLAFGAENATEHVQFSVLVLLRNLVTNDDKQREMVINNPTLVPLLVAKAKSNLRMLQVGALCVLQGLAFNDDNKHEMITNNPGLVTLLMTMVKPGLGQVQVEALKMLGSLAFDVDNMYEMITKNSGLVTLLVTMVKSGSDQVQEEALRVLTNLALNVENRREMLTKTPELVTLLVDKAESNSEPVQVRALFVLQNLAYDIDNAREILTKNPTLVPLLVAKAESNSEQVQNEALRMLQNLAINVDNAAKIMETHSAVLLPLLVAKVNGRTASPATKVVYNLSCSPANRAILRGNDSVVAALTKGREDTNVDISFFSLLTLINLFGAEEDSEVLNTDLAILKRIFKVIARAMNKDGWHLNNPLLAFRYLCVVEHNRQLLWGEYGSKFLTSVLAALQQAIDDKDLDAAENAMSTLAQFSSDPEPLAWMRSNKPQLDEVIAQLAPFPDALKTAPFPDVLKTAPFPDTLKTAPFPDALKTAQFLQLTLEPPKVVAAPATSSKPTIMISYNWKHQAQARLIHSLLESQGYPVWRDEVRMKGNIMDAMASAVSESSIVLVLVSPFYKDSINCKLECLFAHSNKRKLIPVMVEFGYKLGLDWLGLLFAGILYYDVSQFGNDEAQMEPVIRNLLRSEVEGGQVATTVPTTVPATVAPPVAAAPKQSVPQNEAEIRQWLSKHKHGEEIANKLVKEGLVEAEDLEMLSKKSAAEPCEQRTLAGSSLRAGGAQHNLKRFTNEQFFLFPSNTNQMQLDEEVCATPGLDLTNLYVHEAGKVRGGEGTYLSQNGSVISSLLGKVIVSRNLATGEMLIEVLKSRKRAEVLPAVGSLVMARVLRVNSKLCDVQILCVQNKPVRGQGFKGILRKENVRAFEIDQVSMFDCFRIGDLIQCKVAALGGARSYELSTSENELGVVHATCAASGEYMLPASWETMRCPVTGVIEKRKVAKVVTTNGEE